MSEEYDEFEEYEDDEDLLDGDEEAGVLDALEDEEAYEEEGEGEEEDPGGESGDEEGAEESEEEGVRDDDKSAGDPPGPITEAELLAKNPDLQVIQKIDGEEVSIPLKKILDDHRKGIAAEKRWEEAAEVRRELAEKETRLVSKTNRQAEVLRKMLDPERIEDTFAQFEGGHQALMTFVGKKIDELVEEARMTPDQLEAKKYRDKLARYERQQQEREEAIQREQQMAAEKRSQEVYINAMNQEIGKLGVPADSRYAEDIRRRIDELCMEVVYTQQRRVSPSDLSLAAERVVNYFGPLLDAEKAARAPKKAGPKKPPPVVKSRGRRRKAPKAPKIPAKTYLERLAEESGEW